MGTALIWIGAIFIIGGLLVLERHCLGQRAVVHPLVLCLGTGWLTDQVELGLWLGISLQLFSVMPVREVNWALGGTVAAATQTAAPQLGLVLSPGCPCASSLVLLAILIGMGSRFLERVYARIDGERIRAHPPWDEDNPTRAVESLVHRAVVRWGLIGGLEVVAGVGLSLLVLCGIDHVLDCAAWIHTTMATVVPAFGTAVALSALAGYRFMAWACASVILSWAVVV